MRGGRDVGAQIERESAHPAWQANHRVRAANVDRALRKRFVRGRNHVRKIVFHPNNAVPHRGGRNPTGVGSQWALCLIAMCTRARDRAKRLWGRKVLQDQSSADE